MKWTIEKRVALALIVILGVCTCLVSGSFWMGKNIRDEYAVMLQHITDEIIRVKDLSSAVRQQDQNFRIFILTGQAQNIHLLQNARLKMLSILKDLQADTADRPSLEQIKKVELLLEHYNQTLDSFITILNDQGILPPQKHHEYLDVFNQVDVELQILTQLTIDQSRQSFTRGISSVNLIHAAFSIELMLIIVGAIIFVRKIKTFVAQPLAELSAGAKKISQGCFDHRIEMAVVEEFAEVGDAFNKMASALKQAFAELEDSKKHIEQNFAGLQSAQQQLLTSEQRYRELVDFLPVVVYECNRQGQYTFVNETGYTMSGYTPEDIQQGLNVRKLLMPEELETAEKGLYKILTGETLLAHEYHSRRKDGTDFWGQFFTTPLYKNGAIAGARGVVIDITKRKLVEDELRASEQRYRDLVNLVPAVVFEFNREGYYTFVNATGCAVSGYTQEDIVKGLNVRELVISDSWKTLANNMRRIFTGDTVLGTEYQVRRKDGTIFWGQFFTTPLYDNGIVTDALGICIDITERKSAEQALQRSEEKYRELVENANIVILRFDIQGHILFMNRFGLQLFGYAAEELIGYNLVGTIVPHRDGESDDLPSLFSQFFRDHEKYRIHEDENICKDGSRVWIEWTNRLVTETGGAFEIFSIGRDITERKRREVERRFDDLRTETLLALGRMHDRSSGELIDFALEKAVELTESTIGYLAFLNKEQTVLNMCAWSKTAMHECSMGTIPRDYPVASTGLWGEVIRQRKPLITNDYHAPNPFKKGFPAGHVRLHRHMNIPLFDENEIVLVAGVGNKTEEYTEFDIKQLTLLMDGLWKIFKRAQAEESLRESEARFRALVQQAPEAIVVYDSATDRFVDANINAELLFGCSREELLNSGPYRFYPPEQPDGRSIGKSIQEHNKQALAGQEVIFERLVRNARGEDVHCEVRMVRLPSAEYRLLRLSYIDISNRKEAEAALVAERERLAQIIRMSPTIICGIALDGTTTFINPAGEKATGYSAEGITGQNWWALFYPGDMHPQVDNLFALLKQGDVTNHEMTLTTKAQEKLAILWSSITNYDADGNIVEIYGFGNDITDRKKAETALQKSQSRLSGILAALQDMVLLVDRNYTVVWANEKARAVFGEAIVGLLCHNVLNQKQHACDPCPAALCFSDGGVHELEGDIVLPDGSVRRVWHTVSVAEYGSDGRPLLVNEVLRDITEWTMLQQEAFRTDRLAFIGELAAGVAHEINNPIMGIINFAQIISDRYRKQGGDQQIPEKIIQEGERIGSIVRKLLTFASPHDAPAEPVALKKIFDDSYALLQKQFQKNGIRIVSTIPAEIPPVLAQAQKIQQVFINILINAKDALNQKYHGFHKQKQLEISAQPIHDADGLFIRILFDDKGTGISKKIIEKICDPFFTTKPAGKGTGLGLSISHNIIKEHHGRLLFESKEGEYTRVMVDLPVAIKKQSVDSVI